MSTLIHAFAGEGFGHLSRARALAGVLRSRGHQVVLATGGSAAATLRSEGEPVIEVPALVPVIRGNRLRVVRTVLQNASLAARGHDHPALAARFREVDPDLVLVDLEPFSAVTAELMRIPTLSFGRQQILTHTRYRLAGRRRLVAPFARAAVRVLSPLRPQRVLVHALWPGRVRFPGATRLLPPLLRPAALEREPRREDHVLVYFNGGTRAPRVAQRLASAHFDFRVYGMDRPDGFDAPNVAWKETSERTFLNDLASCRAVVASAGFNLMSEAVHFGKPMLVLPNHGNLEQVVNAAKLEQNGWGARSSTDRFVDDERVLRDFLRCLPRAHGRRPHAPASEGPVHIARAIERELHARGSASSASYRAAEVSPRQSRS
jgi:uncharacterized protein (TIGR00661 family)